MSLFLLGRAFWLYLEDIFLGSLSYELKMLVMKRSAIYYQRSDLPSDILIRLEPASSGLASARGTTIERADI